MNVFIIATTTDESKHITPQRIFTTQKLAKEWVKGRAYYWSTGFKKWEYVDDDKTVLKLETNLNHSGEYCIWYIIEYELDNERHSIWEIVNDYIEREEVIS